MNKKANYINLQNKQIRKAMIAKGNFTQIDNDFMVRIIKDCGGTAYSIYMYLSSKLNNTTGVCNPSMRTIANDLAMTAKTVQKNISKLEEAGYLGIEKSKASKNPGEQNNYYFKYPKEVLVCYGSIEVTEVIEIDTEREVVKNNVSKAPIMPTVKSEKKINIPAKPTTVKPMKNKEENDLKSIAIKASKIAKKENEKIDTTPIFNALKTENKDNLARAIDAVLWMAFSQDSEKVSNIFDKKTCSFK